MANKQTSPTRSNSRSAKLERIGRPRASRAETITRITRFLDNTENRSVQLADLCQASGVSERTLRSIFMEVFGLSPIRYLRARKLHALRAELAVARPGIETVTSVARRLGVSDVGRMASDYYALFGEYPRATLERHVASRGKRP